MTYFLASTDSASSDFKDTKTKVVQQEHIISPLTAKTKEREREDFFLFLLNKYSFLRSLTDGVATGTRSTEMVSVINSIVKQDG